MSPSQSQSLSILLHPQGPFNSPLLCIFHAWGPKIPLGAVTTLGKKIVTSSSETKPDFSTSGECYHSAFPCWHFPSALNK